MMGYVHKKGDKVPDDVYAEAVRLMDEEGRSIREAALSSGVPPATLYAAIARGKVTLSGEACRVKGGRYPETARGTGRVQMLFDPLEAKVHIRQDNREIVVNREEFTDMAMAVLSILERFDEE